MLRKLVSSALGVTMVAAIAVVVPISPPLVSAALITSDDFTSGTLAAWTDVTRATIDNAIGSPAAPSMRMAPSAQTAFASLVLGSPVSTVCVSTNVNIASFNAGAGVDLFRLRTAASGGIIRAFMALNGTLQMRNDSAGQTRTTTVALGTGWHNVELCGTVGAATSWSLYRDGVLATTWATNTGTTAVGRVQFGDTAAKTFVANFDHVVIDQAQGDEGGPPTDTTAPTVPGRPTGSSPSTSSIDISWAASTDPSTPITYRIYRDGGATAIGETTTLSFTDTGLVAGSTHTYTVDAVDSVGNASAESQESLDIDVQDGGPDTTPPTVPGRPTGSSPSPSSINISWAASTDPSTPIAYRIYRDGLSEAVGTVTTLSFLDTGLEAGSQHTYTVDAVDSAGNASAKSQVSLPINVQTGDISPPTVPGRPVGSSSSLDSIDISWPASSDPSTPITYRVYRDGGATSIAETTTLSFTDTGLVSGSSHTYEVDAVDSAGNASVKSQASLSITVQVPPPAVIFDEFPTLAPWTVTRLTLSNTIGDPGVPSARAEVTAQSAFGVRDLPATMSQACVSVNVNLVVGSGIDLFRLRTAADGPLMKVIIAADGTVQMRNDLNPATRVTTTALGTGWHNVELCGTIGAATTWTLYHDGVSISTWVTDTGTTPIGRVQIGNAGAATFTANFDHFVVDTVSGDGTPPPADTTAPTVPGRPAGTSPTTSSIQLSWAASSDPSTPITYRVYRDGGATSIGETTTLSFTDTGLASGSSHTYTVDAVDAFGNDSAKSQVSLSITVQVPPPAVIFDDFPTLTAWTVTRLTLSNTAGSPGAPSARAQVTAQSAFGVRNLPATMSSACVSVNVNLASGSGFDLFRLRTAADGPLIKVLIAADGTVQMRNDLNPANRVTTTALGTGWHNVELCGTIGAATLWTLYRDGVSINTWTTNTGTTPIGRVQIGNASSATFTANFDHFVVDTVPGDGTPPPQDTTAPTVPGRPTGTSPSTSSIQLSWAASTDPSTPITYRIYRDGGATSIGETTTLAFTDTGLAGGSSHTYTVDAVDAFGNASVKSQASLSITVQVPPPAVIFDEFPTLAPWTVTRLTLSNTIGDPGVPSARAEVTAQSAFGVRDLPATMSQACVSVNVNLVVGSGIDLFRLRTAADGPLMKVIIAADGTVQMRNDLNPATRVTTTALGTGWHNVELCGTIGAATTWTLYHDGVSISTWVTDTGTTPIGRVQIGNAGAATFTANFDHFVVDTVSGDGTPPPADTTAPTVPGRPAGTSPTTSSIQLSWAASSDPSTPITYRVYRDGGATSIGETTTLSFTDTGLASGSSHTYTVDAVDAFGNDSAKSQVSLSITVQVPPPAVIFDDFPTLTAWTVTRLTLSNTAGSPGAPSARAQVTAQSAFGVRNLPATMSSACVSVNVNLASGSGFDLFRLRTAADGPLIKVLIAADGTVQMRNDLNPANRVTTTALGTGWHNVELCGTIGAATLWTLYRDGVSINTWTTNTGTTPIGRVQIGNASSATFTANFDHFVVDTVPGDGTPPPQDTTAPTVPGRPTGTSPSTSSIQLSWAASTDPSTPITYRIYRDGGATAVGTVTTTSFTDTGLAGGSNHTYTVDAVDAVGNTSAKSLVSPIITVQSPPPPTIVDDFANLNGWTVTRLTISNTAGSPSSPSARANVTSQSAFGVRNLPATMSQACVSVNVNLASGSGIDLFRLRTAADGPLIKVLIAANGTVQMRNDLNPANRVTTTALGTGWHNVELCGTIGTATSWTLYRDGVLINTWTTNTGTTPIGRVQIGNAGSATFTANFDHFVVDRAAGGV